MRTSRTSIGFVERVVDGRLVGWGIADAGQPGPCVIRLFIDGECVAEIVPSIPRPDVSEDGLPGQHAGFEFGIPRRFRDGMPHQVRAVFPDGIGLQFIGGDGGLAPATILVLPPEPQLQGHADGLVDGALRGWAFLVPPGDAVGRGGAAVTVLIDGAEVGTVIASLPRPDIGRMFGVEHCGFAFVPPRRARDGAIHEASFLANGEPLAGCPLHFQVSPEQLDFPLRSCAPSLYDAGGFNEAAHLLDTLRAAGPPAKVTDLGEVFPAGSYHRPMPRELDGPKAGLDALRESLGRLGTSAGPGAASRLVRLEDVFVQDNVIFRVEGDRVEAIYETARGIDRPYVEDREWTPDTLRAAALEIADERPALYLGGVGYTNYGHWLVDDLPRAAALPRLAAATGSGRPVIVLAGTHHGLDAMKELTLRFLHPKLKASDLLFVPPAQPVHFPSLHYVTPVSHHPAYKSPDACALLRARAGRSRRSSRGPERLYVRRSAEHGRGMTNEKAVAALLARRGFTAVDPGELSFNEQVAAFRDARLVVGTMGAAMTSTVFCPEGTQTVYLAPDGWLEPFYWDLAACCGHGYSALFGANASPGAPPHRANFSMDTRALGRMLDRLLAGPG